LVAFWNLNGNGTDEVGSADLTADTGVTWVTGQVNQAAGFLGLFDGTEKLTVTDSTLTMGSAITVATIVKNFPVNTFLKRSESGDSEWEIGAFSSDGIVIINFVVRDNTGSRYSASIDFSMAGFSSTANTFLMVGWSDGTDVGLEVREFETTTTAINISSPGITLGGLSGATLQMGTGFMSSSTFFDATGIWNLVLSSDDRDDLWNAANGIEYPFS
jgi:hypothetical protein